MYEKSYSKTSAMSSLFCVFSWITFRLLTLDNDWPSSLSYRFRSWFLALFLSSSSASSASISRHFISARCGKIIKKISVYNTRIIKLEFCHWKSKKYRRIWHSKIQTLKNSIWDFLVIFALCAVLNKLSTGNSRHMIKSHQTFENEIAVTFFGSKFS